MIYMIVVGGSVSDSRTCGTGDWCQAIDMPDRTARIVIHNKTSHSRLVRTAGHLCRGDWTPGGWEPPAVIEPGQTGGMQSESTGVTGTEGYVKYDVIGNDGVRLGMCYLYWTNPKHGVTRMRFATDLVDVAPDCGHEAPEDSSAFVVDPRLPFHLAPIGHSHTDGSGDIVAPSDIAHAFALETTGGVVGPFGPAGVVKDPGWEFELCPAPYRSSDRPAPYRSSDRMDAGASVQYRAEQYLKAYERNMAGAAGERAVARALHPLTACGWVLLPDRQWPGTSANIDMILVGVGGIVVIDAKNWKVAPRVVDGRLFRGEAPCDREVTNLVRATEKVEDALKDLCVSPAAVTAAMVFTRRSVDDHVGQVRLLGTGNAANVIAGSQVRLSAPVVETIAEHLAGVFPAYRFPSVGDPNPPTDVDLGGPPSLKDVLPIFHARWRTAQEGPIEEWMTFLRPDQYDLVCQRWKGPARISGPAGTGKSVVALHRAAFLARRGGPVLFTTLVRNLPNVQKNLFSRLEPTMRDRVEFLNLHAWARRLLARRGKVMSPDGGDSSFGLAWIKVGRSGVLAEIEPRPTYWHEEINYVIKGRGIVTFEEYKHIRRHGRRTPLQEQHRKAVWDLYAKYEEIQSERGKNDFADVILEALAELRRAPLERPYASVIVDEVQDLTLTAVQLLHALVGDGPDGLLVIGDDQQKVYPGGFKLSDAGIEVRGRARVLRYNYRNGSAIFERAQQVLAGATYEDIDDAEPDREPVGTSDRHGEVIDVIRTSVAELDRALVDSIAEFADDPAHRGAASVLCATNAEVDRYCRVLTNAGLRVEGLKDYEGRTSSAIKVGTYLRAKGLEFKHVFLPRYDEFLREAERGGAADQDWLVLRRNQVYVAMLRARDTLWLGTVAPDQYR
jgi:hypothetical protein